MCQNYVSFFNGLLLVSLGLWKNKFHMDCVSRYELLKIMIFWSVSYLDHIFYVQFVFLLERRHIHLIQQMPAVSSFLHFCLA